MVGTDRHHVLVDVGISGKKVENGLNELGLKTSEMDGILVTHEHIDHIAGLGVLARRYSLPIYATKGTKDAILKTSSVGKIDADLIHEIKADEEFTIGDLKIDPMHVSHDAADPVAYILKSGDKGIGIVTDLGVYTDYTVDKIKGLDALLLEANHDIRMLEVGVYPYHLKQRILSDRGHLSNESSGKLLTKILHDNFKTVVLGHLSKENNMPELAYETVRLEVTADRDCPYKGDDFPIRVANRDGVSEKIVV